MYMTTSMSRKIKYIMHKVQDQSSLLQHTNTRGTDHSPPPFSNFLFTNLFSITFLYFFIVSTLFPYFNLFVSIFIQSYANIKLHVSTLLYTNNTQGMQLGRFENRTPARFEYIYCTLFPLCHSNQDMYPFLKDAPVFVFCIRQLSSPEF